jgi:acyl-CoA dehydrogenase
MMCWKAAWMADEGLPNTKEASMAKAYAGEMGVEVCFQALQLMGPEGLSEDHLVEKWFRDIRVYNIFEGTAQVNRIVVAKRELGYQHN